MTRTKVTITATAGAAAGVLGLAAMSLPSATADPQLPDVAPEQLVESVMTAAPPALTGTVEVDNALGLPSVPGAGQAGEMLADGNHTVQLWTDGAGRQRVSVPSAAGEHTIVNDGSTVWTWDSATQTATRSDMDPAKRGQWEKHHADQNSADPAKASRTLVGSLRETSTVRVDGTASVAGRDAYELVLTPKPTERTVLREVRIAVDAEKRVPLNVVVNTNGSDDPALQVGFSELDMTAPQARLFQFTPPAGAKVEESKKDEGAPEHAQKAQKPPHRTVGEGWDTVLLGRMPQEGTPGQTGDNPGNAEGNEGVRKPDGQQQDLRGLAERVGKKVSGPWGEGWILSTKAGSVLMTSDGRLAAGAVPEQVLTEAIGNA